MGEPTQPDFLPKDVAEILSWAVNEPESADALDPVFEDEERMNALHHLLQVPLYKETAVIETLPPVLAQICVGQSSPAGETIGQALQNPNAAFGRITQIKTYAKHLAKSACRGPEQEASNIVYHAAIASALVYHNRSITSCPSDKLKRGLEQLSGISWIGTSLASLFAQASRICDTGVQDANE